MLLGVDSAAFVRRQFSLSSYANQGLKVCHSASSRPAPTLKKRIRWTPDLRNEFVKCVERLGGPEKAIPKAILKLMETNLLTIFHLKSHLQVHPVRYNSISSCFTTLLREQGPSAFWRGWAGKFFGYGVQGGCRFGLYEYFKRLYSDIFVDHNRSFIFFLSGASAEVFANIALCPFEAIKVRVQAQPHFAKGLADGFPKLYASEGIHGSEISRVNQGHLLLQCVLHNLDSSSSKQFIKDRSSLDAWRQHISSKNLRVENCSTHFQQACGITGSSQG